MAKILMAMSGGVDSSTTALKLLEEGHEVIGVTLTMGRECDEVVVDDARKVARVLGVEHKILDVKEQFKSGVLDYFVKSYRIGETPNPCAVCNRKIKFKSIIDLMKEIKADFVATGHYANIVENDGKYELHKAKCLAKDQSYFLSDLKYDYLQYIKFPLGTIKDKEEVRKIAKTNGLAVADKKDSQDICFVENDYKDFLRKTSNIPEKTGFIKHINGKILGKHKGILNYTIGQRKGLGVAYKTPIYVVKLDVKNNIVFVGGDGDLFSNKLMIRDLNLLAELEEKSYTMKLRSTHKGQEGIIKLIKENDKAEVILEEQTRAATVGQLCCIYDGTKVVGAGWIC